MNIELIRKFVEEKLSSDKTGHDLAHIRRVENNALRLCEEENFTDDEISIIIAAVLLHDVIDYKLVDDVEKASREVHDILIMSGANGDEIEEIEDIINNMSFSKNLIERKKLSKYGEIVQDADRLDAIGAIGIGRTFYYGGAKGHAFYDDTTPTDLVNPTEDDYKNSATVINHFYEKLLKLKDLMNTDSAKKEAEIRTEFMKKFLEQFYREI